MPVAAVGLLDLPPDIAEAFEIHLAASDYAVLRVSRSTEWETRAECVIAQVKDPGADRAILSRAAQARVPILFVVSSRTPLPEALSLLASGAADLLVPPVPGLALLAALHRVLASARLVRTVGRLEGEVERLTGAAHGLVGDSPALRKIREEIGRAAEAQGPVLILGETGVGKELVARAIHHAARASGMRGEFIAVNAAAIPGELFEAEIFGYEPGAFTGASGKKKGLLELADGGTLFLDEVADLVPTSQARLLRVLDDGVFRRLGGTREIRVRTKIVTATNAPLAERVRDGKFRNDLYYRLAAHVIEIPPLRERPQDIYPIVDWFLRDFSSRLRRNVPDVPEAVRARLAAYPWPGNVRELRHTVERMLLYGPEEVLLTHGSPAPATHGDDSESRLLDSYRRERTRALASFDSAYFSSLLDRTGGNLSEAARIAGIDRKTFSLRIKRTTQQK